MFSPGLPLPQSFYFGANCFVLLLLLPRNYVSIKVYKMGDGGGERVKMWGPAPPEALGEGGPGTIASILSVYKCVCP